MSDFDAFDENDQHSTATKKQRVRQIIEGRFGPADHSSEVRNMVDRKTYLAKHDAYFVVKPMFTVGDDARGVGNDD